jgi:serine/threonine protein kinase/formylglycine-generating enzyme required for sulfatase activity/dienelactone hydrolase
MESDRWRQIDELLEQALEIPPEDRSAFLDIACSEDPELRSHVDRLLRAHEHASRFLAAPALGAAARQIADEVTAAIEGRTIGHYQVATRLGAGGMGVVYLARDIRLDRMVALKFLPSDLVGDEEHKLRFLREAKASAALEHPNIGAIHEIAETPDGQMFIVMGYYEADTLRQRIRQGPLGVTQAIDIARQIAAGLSHAHSHGVVHRDVKPGNILITKDGVVKIIDFGLAKLGGLPTITKADRMMGTVSYLSPEQARGDDVDQRTDLWSLGVVMYEMLAGHVPFQAEHPEATIHRILTDNPNPLTQLRNDVPVEIERIIGRALQKELTSRCGSAAALMKDLTDSQSSLALREQRRGETLTIPWMTQKRVAVPAVLALIVLGSLLAWRFDRHSKVKWAREALLPEISRLMEVDQYTTAFGLARQAERYIPDDPQLLKLWPLVSKAVSIRTTPAGADVYAREYNSSDATWTYLGKSPLDTRIPFGLFRWKAEKSGFVSVEDVASGWYGPISFVLDPMGNDPAGMVRVQGGRSPVSLIVTGFENLEPVQLQDYWMDRYEVSNKQFKRFVDGGGYQSRQYWKHPLFKDGRTLSWVDAMTEFRDATGRPGPSVWEAGDYPKGQDDYPVRGVSWYEAAAYADFAGKSLPTIYHWNRAAITVDAWISSYIFPFSNFGGRGPAPIGSHHGMSRSGTYDMAGNVKEWCWNEAVQGRRYILGGAWDEPAYMFHEADARPPLQRDATFGFRCMKALSERPQTPALMDPVASSGRSYAKAQPVPQNVFRVYRDLYAYDRSPLNAVVEATDGSNPDWIRQRITFDAAYGKERMVAYLFLPRNSTPPYQTVVHFPAAESMFVRSSDDLVEMSRVDFILKSGRAVLWPIYKGTYERPDDMQSYFPNMSIRYRDRVISWGKDLGRSIDYLETRSEIDRNKLGFYGYSWGACLGAILPAVEDRLKVSVLMGPGLYLQEARPEVDQINFVTRVTIPTLIVDGRDDFVFPRETSQEPFYRFLGTPKEHKRRVVLDGGHSVPRHHLIRESLDWLDRYLGPVQRTNVPHSLP